MATTTLHSGAAAINPMMALSAFTAAGSSSVLCAAVATAAAAQAAPGQGCVLPIQDAPAPVAQEAAPPAGVIPAATPRTGLSLSPLLVGLGLIAALAAAVALLTGDNHGRPTSPS